MNEVCSTTLIDIIDTLCYNQGGLIKQRELFPCKINSVKPPEVMLLCEAGKGLELISCLSFRCTYIEQKLYELESKNTVSKAMKLECWATIGSCVLCVGGIFLVYWILCGFMLNMIALLIMPLSLVFLYYEILYLKEIDYFRG